MKVKYFQAIADIERHYDDIVKQFNPELKYGLMLLETWDITVGDKENILEEREVLRYLIACQYGFTQKENVKKPSLEVVNRCFNRQLSFLEKIHKCHAYNVNRHHCPISRKEYKACRHYLFQFSLPAWYAKLPDEILSFENKYPRFRKEVAIEKEVQS